MSRMQFGQALRRGLRFRCPNCGEGPVFRGFFKMRDQCDVCGLSFHPESGYYAGAMYLDYALSAAIFLAVFIPSFFLPDFTHLSYATKNILWICFGATLCLALSRPSYSLWLGIDFWMSPWKAPVPRRNQELIELPLVSMVIRTDRGEPHPGTRHRPEN